MKDYLRVLGYVFRFWRYLVPAVICMVFYVVFSAFSLTTILPFINVLFGQQEQTAKNEMVISPSPAEKTDSVDEILKNKKGLPDYKVLFEQKINEFLQNYSQIQALQLLCIIILVGFFFKNLFAVGQNYFMAPVEQGFIAMLRNELFEHFQRMSLSYFHGERAGMLISRVTNDVSIVNASIAAAINSLFRDPLALIIYLSLMIMISWKLTLAVFILFPVAGWILSTLGNQLKQDSERMQERLADITSVLSETLYGIRVVKAFAMELFEINKFRKQNDNFKETVIRMSRIRKLSPSLTEYIGVLVGVLVLFLGGTEVLTNKNGMTPGQFIAFLLFLFAMMEPLKLLGQIYNSTREGLVAAQRVFRVLDTPPAIVDAPNAVEKTSLEKGIEFQNISFRYDSGENVLEQVSCSISKGQILAIVGPSGSGKSTLLDLLIRFYEPQRGNILIDGLDIRKIKLNSLRGLMGIVTQETILFNDSIKNNIAYGLDSVDDQIIIQAAKAANAHDFIMEFPEKYATQIGDRGVKLSGGQRQRLAIARSILKNPPILIFDEATSALDTQSEVLVQAAIENLLSGRTALVVAHRLSTIRNANKIIVIENGKIVQEGIHNDLVAQTGLYQKLYQMQFRN
jgi:subfamily B ATP-binding cassette protein MsbA